MRQNTSNWCIRKLLAVALEEWNSKSRQFIGALAVEAAVSKSIQNDSLRRINFDSPRLSFGTKEDYFQSKEKLMLQTREKQFATTM